MAKGSRGPCIVVDADGPCDALALARGLCGKHYQRWWKHDDPLYVCPPRPRAPKIIGSKRRPPTIGSHDAAWLAGLFEGEGTIFIRPNHHLVRLAIQMNDRDVLERVDALVPSRSGVRPITRKNAPAHWKQSYVWYIGRKDDVEACLRAMLPWLGERRKARALEALYVIAMRHPGTTGHQWRSKTHCPQGHPYDEANTYVTRSGGRHCRQCRAAEQLRRQRRKRAAAENAYVVDSA